jgi:hypothetical protein
MNSGHTLIVYLLLLYTQTCSSLHSSALFKLSVSGKCCTCIMKLNDLGADYMESFQPGLKFQPGQLKPG